MDTMKLFEKIKLLRLEKDITQQFLSESLNLPRYIISNWEQGRSEPNLSDISKLADFFECSIDYLLGREDDFGNVVISNGVTLGLEPGEEELIKNFRQLNMYQRDAISLQAKILAEDNLKVIKK